MPSPLSDVYCCGIGIRFFNLTTLFQVCPRQKKLTDQQTANMIRKTAVRPAERKANIINGLKMMNNNYMQEQCCTRSDGELL
jgi:hypothetical protein